MRFKFPYHCFHTYWNAILISDFEQFLLLENLDAHAKHSEQLKYTFVNKCNITSRSSFLKFMTFYWITMNESQRIIGFILNRFLYFTQIMCNFIHAHHVYKTIAKALLIKILTHIQSDIDIATNMVNFLFKTLLQHSI